MINIKQLTENYNNAKQTFVNEVKTNFAGLFTEVFAKNPQMNSFAWEQYTPYFNDGDTCEFGVRAYDDAMYYNGDRYWDLEEEDQTDIASASLKEASNIIQSIDEDILLDCFGDHATITVNRDGTISIEGCDHE